MRTTLTLSDDLFKAARMRAAETQRSLKDVINEALRIGLAKAGRPGGKPYRFNPPTFKGNLLPGVRLDSRDWLLDYLDGIPRT
ncbi:MAG: DUF2191 domain-containing protein [Planctomycetes bacterium]|nr:DUF2191 domain-containing protein [Planctomycetota bacterium]